MPHPILHRLAVPSVPAAAPCQVLALAVDGDIKYVYKTGNGTVRCDNATFGDPAVKKIKACEVSAG